MGPRAVSSVVEGDMGVRGPRKSHSSNRTKRAKERGKIFEAPDPQHPLESPIPLTEAEQVIFSRKLEQLQALKRITASDLETLARYCQHLADYVHCRGVIAKKEMTYKTDGRYGLSIRIRPEVTRIEKLEPVLIRIEREFGFTPASKLDIPATTTEEDREAERFLFGG